MNPLLEISNNFCVYFHQIFAYNLPEFTVFNYFCFSSKQIHHRRACKTRGYNVITHSIIFSYRRRYYCFHSSDLINRIFEYTRNILLTVLITYYPTIVLLLDSERAQECLTMCSFFYFCLVRFDVTAFFVGLLIFSLYAHKRFVIYVYRHLWFRSTEVGQKL